MNKVIIIVILFAFNLIRAQGVVNTESILNEIENGFNLSGIVEGDFQRGNVNLIEFNASNLFSYSTTSTLVRLISTYEYLEEDNEMISNDITSHLRLNFYGKNRNSLFLFLQAQSAASMFQKSRILEGLGYRLRLFKNNKSNYFDIAPGFFHESEVYDYENQITKVNNLRLSLNNFFNIQLSEKFNFSNVTYLQFNAKNTEDIRLFVEPKFTFNMDKFSLFLRYSYKHHSTPYIDIFNSDTDLLFGLEFTFN